MKNKKVCNFLISQELDAKLREYCDKYDKVKGKVIERAIEEYIGENNMPVLEKIQNRKEKTYRIAYKGKMYEYYEGDDYITRTYDAVPISDVPIDLREERIEIKDIKNFDKLLKDAIAEKKKYQ